MKPRFIPIALLLAVLLPSLAGAMTKQDVVKLAASNVGDDVIISQIEASGEVFTLTVDDILDLKKAGVSDRVISFMINTGKDDVTPRADDDDADVRYQSSVDSRYRDAYGYHDGYDDPYWNVYLSWGYGRYYDPWYYSTWWPTYSHYYYPVNCYRSYWPYYPPRWHDGGHYNAGYRQVKQGREVYGRGGASSRPGGGNGTRSSEGTPASRTYKGRGAATNRGGTRSQEAPPPSNSGRTKKKSPTIGNRGSQSPPPPPSSGGSQQGGSGVQSPPPASQSGRTMKKS